MADPQEQYDDAMLDFSMGDYDKAIAAFRSILEEHPAYFDAQLGLGIAYYRKGDYAAAIREGHKAEALKPDDQLVHTNLSLFYMKNGDKQTAEAYGLKAKVASWKEASKAPEEPSELDVNKPKPEKITLPGKSSRAPGSSSS